MKTFSTALLVLALMAGSALAGPDARISHDAMEFGYVPFGSVVSHSVWVRSVGDDTLVIDTVLTGCVCATAPITVKELAPGDSAMITFFWDLKARIGPIGVYPAIYTNVRKEPYYVDLTGTATRSADKLRPVSFKPFRLAFARTTAKSIDTIEVTIQNHSDDAIGLSRISFPPEEIELSFPDSVGAGETVTGLVWVESDHLDTEFQGSVTFRLSDQQEKSITIPYHRKFFIPGVESALGP